MINMKISASVVVFFLCMPFLYAQESSNASGGDATGSGGSVAYSVGQIAHSSNTGSGGTESQGVQQTYFVSTVGSNELSLNYSLSVFPNPTTNSLTIETSEISGKKLSYQLFNMQAQLLKSNQIVNDITTIDSEELPKGTYFLKIHDAEQEIKSFKIIKN